jgi:hypothetical protein
MTGSAGSLPIRMTMRHGSVAGGLACEGPARHTAMAKLSAQKKRRNSEFKATEQATCGDRGKPW